MQVDIDWEWALYCPPTANYIENCTNLGLISNIEQFKLKYYIMKKLLSNVLLCCQF